MGYKNIVEKRYLTNISVLRDTDTLEFVQWRRFMIPVNKEVYDRKVDLYDKFQHGRDLSALNFTLIIHD